ncbi:hypothetical protein CEXT_586951 [Caerostris extrusa]|uniref:Uncharacterized protein n=1 Tax=Caerostris extrusa TaxID=172846 RepID=A0AAV4RQS3_CAEEX|nr:hypothetical protein CEXT_586951 [Caerostris extrusa]
MTCTIWTKAQLHVISETGQTSEIERTPTEKEMLDPSYQDQVDIDSEIILPKYHRRYFSIIKDNLNNFTIDTIEDILK